MKLVAEKVMINVGRGKDEFIEVSIYINKNGRIIFDGLPSVYYEMLGEELSFIRVEGEE